MKKITIHFIGFALIALSIWSCSTKKNTFISRNTHTLATKYNVLYNGKVAYEVQKKQIDNAYQDDFYTILPIEPLKVEEKLALPGPPGSKLSAGDNSGVAGFKKAEEKAVKAIQKHSMNINASEKNKQIDDAYLLLGKSRYYDQRFVPALETFKYIIKKYPKSKLFNQARVWEAKTLIRLGQEDDAIYKLDHYLTKTDNLSNATRANAHTALAQAFTKQDSVQQVINNLNSALFYANKNSKDKITTYDAQGEIVGEDIANSINKSLKYTRKNSNQTTRNAFILAQLYRKQEKIDSSNMLFNKIAINKKAPYRYRIYAQIERAKNYNKESDNTEELLASLKKLTKNRDNRPYLDGIFYQIGKISLINKNTDEALDFFKKSILTKQAKDVQKSYAYEQVGNIYFDKANFKNAGSYYDSVLNITKNKNTKRIKKLTRKRKSLNEVIRLENIATKNDSILGLVAMSKEDQNNFFQKHIDQLKKKDEQKRIIEENKNKANGSGSQFSNSSQINKSGKFYFYNTQSVGFGQQEFQKIWGKRALTDNWRNSIKLTIDKDSQNNEAQNTQEIDESRKYELAYYLEKIPTETKSLDSIATKRNKAYYNLGLIYKEQFNKYELATTRLEKLLTQQPDQNLILPSYYHLYKSYTHFDQIKSDYYKNKITSVYPDSRYAQLIKNPKLSSKKIDDKNSPEEIYKTVYTLYIDKKYQDALTQSNKYIKQFVELPIIPKFELLKAHAIAKLDGKDAFITALKYVLANHPNTEEGIRAAEILAFLRGEKIPKKEKSKKPIQKEVKEKTKTQKEKIKRTGKGNLPSKKEMMDRIKKSRKGNNIGPPGRG